MKKRKLKVEILSLKNQDIDDYWLHQSSTRRLLAASDLIKRYCAMRGIKNHHIQRVVRKTSLKQSNLGE